MNGTRYMITNGKQYLYSGENGAKLVNEIVYATTWDKKNSAQNVLTTYKNSGKSQVLGNTAQKKEFIVKEIDSNSSQISKVIQVEWNNNMIVEEQVLDFDIADFVKELKEKTEKLENRLQYLFQQLSYCDKKIVDIEHCAEFYSLDIQKGFKLYKILHDTTQNRRVIKNEIQSIQVFLGSANNSTSIVNVSKSIYDIYNNKEYTPRVVDELFDLLK